MYEEIARYKDIDSSRIISVMNGRAPDNGLKKPELFSGIVTKNQQMFAIFQQIESIAPTMQPVLITGETGVGKELVAKIIHKLSGLKGRLVTVNVAGLDDNVFSDTLFGHVRGAFTGADRARRGLVEEAAGGTLVLDEIGDLSLASQVKLLRLLQEGEFLPLGSDKSKLTDVHIITVTNTNLWDLQKSCKFRKDLNYRIRTHHIHLPLLRERKDDLPLLVDHFLTLAAKAMKKKKPTLPNELAPLLKTYSFPGNIRELKAMVFDAVSRSRSRKLSMEVFKHHTSQGMHVETTRQNHSFAECILAMPSEKMPTLKQVTQYLIAEAMRRTDGNITHAARMLGISRQALGKRLKNGRS